MEEENKKEKTRTLLQNRSIHKYFQEVADMLNESGIPIAVFYSDIEADYTKEAVKSLFRAFLKEKYGKDSTKQMDTKEVQEVWEEVNRHLSKHGIHIPFPSREQLINYDDERFM